MQIKQLLFIILLHGGIKCDSFVADGLMFT